MRTGKFNNFGLIAAELQRGGPQIVKKGAFDVSAHAKTLVRVDTGNLKNSIRAEKLEALRWIVVTVAEYGIYQEYGPNPENPSPWGFTPFMRPAREKINPGYIKAWREFLSQVGGGLAIGNYRGMSTLDVGGTTTASDIGGAE